MRSEKKEEKKERGGVLRGRWNYRLEVEEQCVQYGGQRTRILTSNMHVSPTVVHTQQQARISKTPHRNRLAEVINFDFSSDMLSFRVLVRGTRTRSWRFFLWSIVVKKMVFSRIIIAIHIFNTSRTASRTLLPDLMMQLLDTILLSTILALSFPTTLAIPAANSNDRPCPTTLKILPSLPYNFSLEILGRYETLESKPQHDRPFVRIYSESNREVDAPELSPREKGATVFQLKDRKLIPLGGSSPAELIDPRYAGSDEVGGFGSFVFNSGLPIVGYVNFTAYEKCDYAGRFIRKLEVDDREFVYYGLPTLLTLLLSIDEQMTSSVRLFFAKTLPSFQLAFSCCRMTLTHETSGSCLTVMEVCKFIFIRSLLFHNLLTPPPMRKLPLTVALPEWRAKID